MPGYVDRFERDLEYHHLDRHMRTVHGYTAASGIPNRRYRVAEMHQEDHDADLVAHPEEER